MRGEALDPSVQPEKREVVRGQGKRLGRYRIAQFGQGREVAGEGIAVGLVRLDADVGRDPRQYLVARDQHTGLGAIKACELRRMAFADDDPPFPSADLDRHPVGKPLKTRRHRRDAAAVAVLPLAEKLGCRVVEARAASETTPHRGEILGSMAHHPGGQPFLLGDPQGRLPTPGQPIGEPDVVRVVVRHDDPSDRQSAEPLGKDPFPQLLGLRPSSSRCRRSSSPRRLRAATN